MKKLLKNLIILSLALLLLPVACSKDDKEKQLSAEEAKAELRAASQDMTMTFSNVMEVSAMSTMIFFMELAEFDDFDPGFKSLLSDIGKYDLTAKYQILKGNRLQLKKFRTKSFLDEPGNSGVYTYNFQTGQFDLTSTNVNYLRYNFPADEDAYDQEINNASLTISNIEFATVSYTDEWGTWEEEVLTKLNMALVINSAEALTISFNATYSSGGTPTSMSLNMSMPPYVFSMTLNGSGVNYKTTISFTQNSTVILNASLDLKYDQAMEEIERVSGNFHMPPLNFEGSINGSAIDNCEENVTCINQNFNVTVKHTELNSVLGKLEFRNYTDPYWEEEYPALVIVYKDNSWEYLHDVFAFLPDLGK
jgi:hypothetical protein